MEILVADDSKTNLALISTALQKLGHTVIVALSGEAAIEKFQAHRPELIILDVVMEGMDGFECAKKLREIDNENWIPIIFLSASLDDESIAKGINAGGDDYLTKPFSEITLAAKIRAMQRIAEMRKKLFELTQKLSVLSSTDTLTGIYNRLQFNKALKEKIAHVSRKNITLALLFMDLDRFKTINDTLGHHIGDLLLKEVARRLQSCLREDDFVARLGGDEFAVILTGIEHPYTTERVAQKILNTLSSTYHLADHDIHISASIGIACYPSAGTTQKTLINNADIAMYHAKELGGNNFQHFTEELLSKYMEHINLGST